MAVACVGSGPYAGYAASWRSRQLTLTLTFICTSTQKMPPKKAARKQAKASPKKRAAVEAAEQVVIDEPPQGIDLTVGNVLSQPIAVAKAVLNDRRYFWLVAGLLAAFQLVLGVLIILKVPCRCTHGLLT